MRADSGFHSADGPRDLAAGAGGTLYISGLESRNAFAIRPSGEIAAIIDDSGDWSFARR